MTARRSPQFGQASVEYLIVAAGLVGALFVADFGGRTGAQHLADMIRLFFRNLTYFLSLP
jgi:hypothetical protein